MPSPSNNATDVTESDDSGLPPGVIVVIVLCGVFAVCVLGAIVVLGIWLYRRKRNRKPKSDGKM